MFNLRGKRVWVTGHRGMLGSALVRRLEREECQVLTIDRETLNLLNQRDVLDFVGYSRPDAIIMAAAKVGGILANVQYPAEFLHDNISMQSNIFEAAFLSGVEKLLFLGSSCIYPLNAHRPIREEALMTGSVEPTNEWYAIAKISGIKLAEAYRKQYGSNYISAIPTNLYGPGDNFNLESGHVVAALIRKIHQAKIKNSKNVTIWGTGTPCREFLYIDDCADALVFLLKHYSSAMHINVGSRSEISIIEIARLIAEVVGFEGEIEHDLEKPDGVQGKLMNSDRLAALGWAASTSLQDGLRTTYQWYCNNSTDSAPPNRS